MGIDAYPDYDRFGAAGSTLAYAQVTADQLSIGTSNVDLAGLAVTATVPPGRRLRITGYVPTFYGASANGDVIFQILEGATQLANAQQTHNSGWQSNMTVSAILSPAEGAHTYKLVARTGAGTIHLGAGTTTPAFILVEDITGTLWPGGMVNPDMIATVPWTAITVFTNSWVNYGGTYTPAAYRKVNDLVYLRGLIALGTLSTPAFNLPVGYRPAWDHHFAALSNAALGGVRIFQDGRVTPGDPGSNAWIALDGIVFGVT